MSSVTNAKSPLLRVHDLAITYKNGAHSETTAVDGVAFSICDGEIVGLLGESGCGKTTIGMALLRMLPSTARQSGAVYFRGKDIANLSQNEMRKVRGAGIATVFQDPALALNPVMRVREQVAEVLRAHSDLDRKECRRLVEELLADLELGDVDRIGNSYPHQLSGGQCQRILIAQSLICNPGLIIADEPTASLDARTALEVINLIRRINQTDSTAFLFISHDPAVLRAVADTVIVMRAGKIVEQGTVAQVLSHPLHPYTRALLAARQGSFDKSEFISAETSSSLAGHEGVSRGH
jgi:ABC-type glutathione transport system ATPase component